ncbi:unnamed protein product [Brugia pahangi]|uniref:Uncharacterized protein n=1 Tax=Brugia pahangi TaxID=6280 RepID=A0A0N4T1F7_BRUPA|nr:unnamed protein product [Brugia pahangi]
MWAVRGREEEKDMVYIYGAVRGREEEKERKGEEREGKKRKYEESQFFYFFNKLGLSGGGESIIGLHKRMGG